MPSISTKWTLDSVEWAVKHGKKFLATVQQLIQHNIERLVDQGRIAASSYDDIEKVEVDLQTEYSAQQQSFWGRPNKRVKSQPQKNKADDVDMPQAGEDSVDVVKVGDKE